MMLPSPMVAPDQDSSLWYLLIPFQIKSSKRNIRRSLNLPWAAVCPWLSSKLISRGTSLLVQCLRPWAPNAGGPGSITSQGNRSHMPQLSQINTFLKKYLRAIPLCPGFRTAALLTSQSRVTSTWLRLYHHFGSQEAYGFPRAVGWFSVELLCYLQ